MNELYELDENTQAMLDALGYTIAKEESLPQVMDVSRLHQFLDAWKHFQAIADGNWKVSCTLHEPFTSMGVISAEAEEFTFDQMQELHLMLARASNVEIYPLINGNLKMNVTFHGITRRV